MISILIGTYGDDRWKQLGARALKSAMRQGGDFEIRSNHDRDGTIASVRNGLAESAEGDFLCFLDGDDELAPGFIHAMEETIEGLDRTLYTPAVSYIKNGRAQAPKFWPERPLNEGNWLIIGTLVPRDLFLKVGGFPEGIDLFEDWALFAKCWREGVTIKKVPKAIYKAHVSSGSRNRSMSRQDQVNWHYTIGKEIFPDYYTDAWLRQHMRNAKRVKT